MDISCLLSPDAPRGSNRITHLSEDRPQLFASTPADVPIQAPSPIHPINQAALWENGGYDIQEIERTVNSAMVYDPVQSSAMLSQEQQIMGDEHIPPISIQQPFHPQVSLPTTVPASHYPNVLNDTMPEDHPTPKRTAYYKPEMDAARGVVQTRDAESEEVHLVSIERQASSGSYHAQQHTPSERDQEPEIHEDDNPALSAEEVGRVDYLRSYLRRVRNYRPSYIELIALLQRRYETERSLEVLEEIQNLRETLLENTALGEEEWLRWLLMEEKNLTNLDGIMKMIELCARAVDEQPKSIQLWTFYVSQVESQYKRARSNPVDDEYGAQLGDIFDKEMLLNVYGQAAEAIQYNIAESSPLWDRYIELLSNDLASSPSEDKVQNLRETFLQRLGVPHRTIESTFSAFSSFVTTYDNINYEDVMISTNRVYTAGKAKYEEREILELNLKRAIEAGDANAEWQYWNEYLRWETGLPKKKLDMNLACALFERACIRYDITTYKFWEWYLDFTLHKANGSPLVLTLMQRALRIHPTHTEFWIRYMIALERSFKPYMEVQNVKLKAVENTYEEYQEQLVDIYLAWCGYLRRRYFDPAATEESRIEDEEEIFASVSELEQYDENARLSRFYITFCTQKNPPDILNASNRWSRIMETATSSDVILECYAWELQWGNAVSAGTILRKACQKATVANYETLFEAYRRHVLEWGDVKELESSIYKLRKWAEPLIAEKAALAQQQAEAARAVEEEAALAREAEAVAADEPVVPLVTISKPATTDTQRSHSPSPNKRKRTFDEEEEEERSPQAKKNRSTESSAAFEIEPATEAPAPRSKRDREHTTVIVRNLPPDVKEIRLRQFFRDCGTINSLKIVVESEKESATATIEFDSREDVLTAQTKDMKTIDGREIEVQVGEGSTLYVTNFPPSADEDYIRRLFKDFEGIVDIRFPSLKYNTHRRFCYVQFASSKQARKATSLDGKKVGPKEKLVVKISDPAAKQERSGPIYDGREVFLKNIDFRATEEDIKKFFQTIGEAESVRLPAKNPGKHQGFGFVVFKTKEAAERALGLNDEKLFDRKLSVRASIPQGGKVPATSTGQARAVSVTPGEGIVNGEQNIRSHSSRGSPVHQPPSLEEIKRKTLGIMNVADTVNDTRIRELFEQYGTLRKVQLRPDHQGAVVEFVNVADAGKASLALEGYVLDGKAIRIGEFPQLLKAKPEKEKKGKGAQFEKYKKDEKKKKGEEQDQEELKEKAKSGIFAPPVIIQRPIAPGMKRRVGLGFKPAKKENSFVASEDGRNTEINNTNLEGGEKQSKLKSNADFRALFIKK